MLGNENVVPIYMTPAVKQDFLSSFQQILTDGPQPYINLLWAVSSHSLSLFIFLSYCVVDVSPSITVQRHKLNLRPTPWKGCPPSHSIIK